MNMRSVSMALAVSIVIIPAARAVDDSCRGVQAMATTRAFAALDPAAQERLRGEMSQIQALGSANAADIRQAEEDFTNLVNGIRAANPGASEAQIEAQLFQQVRTTVEADNIMARDAYLQAEAHEGERQMIVRAAAILAEANAQPRRLAAEEFAAASENGAQWSSAAMNNEAVQQLMSVQAASEAAAAAGREPNVAALASRRFDREGGSIEGRFNNAVAAVSTAAVQAYGARFESDLIFNHHHSQMPRESGERARLMRSDRRTTREFNAQRAVAANQSATANETFRRITRARLEPPPPQPSARRNWQRRAAEALEQVASTLPVVAGEAIYED